MTSVETPAAGKEKAWYRFLSDCTSWQYRRVLKKELVYYDAYMGGDMSLMDIFAEVAEAEDTPPTGYSVKV